MKLYISLCISFHSYIIGFVVPNHKELKELARKKGFRGTLEEICNNSEVEKEAQKLLAEAARTGKLSILFKLPCKTKLLRIHEDTLVFPRDILKYILKILIYYYYNRIRTNKSHRTAQNCISTPFPIMTNQMNPRSS